MQKKKWHTQINQNSTTKTPIPLFKPPELLKLFIKIKLKSEYMKKQKTEEKEEKKKRGAK